MDCVKVVENLSQKEKNSILHVLQRDEQLRHGQEQKISNLKKEIHQIRMCSVLRAGDDQAKICLRCRSEMGVIFNRGSLCPSCKYKVCKNCQEVMFNGSWLCRLCYKQRQLKWLSGEWTASFDQNPLRKWASGSDIMKATLQLVPGTTSIDIDDSPGNQGNNRQGRKVSRNGFGAADQSRSRVEVPKEGDQLKLSELFNVLRVKKPEEKVTQETQVRRITSRKYSESDSDSSSNSDVDIKSTSTAPSVTESELDGRRIESPRYLESPPLKTEESPLDSSLSETPERYKSSKKVESQEYRLDNEAQRPKPSPRSPKPAARRKVKSEHYEQENVTPVARPRTKDRRSPRSDRMVEGQVSMSRSAELQSSASRQVDDNEPFDKTSVHSELSLHVAKTRESLDKKFEVEKSRSHNSLDNKSLESDILVRPKSKEQIVRKSADNLSTEQTQALTSDQLSLGKSIEGLDNKSGAASESRRNNRDIGVKSSDSRGIKSDEPQNQKDIDSYSDKSIQSKHSIEKDLLLTTRDDDGHSQRAGSPYSFSMDSLPSSHPSPTFNRGSISSNPDSDTDSMARVNTRPEPIVEVSPVSEKSARSEPKIDEGDNVVVEEISKVQFRRVSKTVGQIGALAKLSVSPNRNVSADVVVEQRETQSRGGSRLREEGGEHDTNNVIEVQKLVEEDLFVQGIKSQNLSSSSNLTDMLLKKLESMGIDRERNNTEMSQSRKKSAEEMTWISECEIDNREIEIAQLKSVKRLPRFMTSSVASENERKPSEADSIEDMIDSMARAHLFVDTNLPARASEGDSDGGYTLTPVTPFPQEIYEKRSGKYNRFAYISDDNLDGDSADDLLDDENDIEKEKITDLEKSLYGSQRDTGPQQENKKELSSMDSLDLILDSQGEFIDGMNDDTELEKEYQNALKFSKEEIASNMSKQNTRFSEDDIIDNIPPSNLDEQKTFDDVGRDVSYDKSASALQKLPKSDIQLTSEQKCDRRQKLKAADSLDILLSQQGNLIDINSQNVEFDADLISDLEKNFKDTVSLQKSNPSLSKEYAYLGMQHDVKAEKATARHSGCESVIYQDDFDALVGDAKDYLDGKADGTPLFKPKLQCIEYIKHENSPESSDSDILSVIEEVEDERSESSDDDSKMNDTKRKTDINSCCNSSNNNMYISKLDKNEEEKEISKEKLMAKDTGLETSRCKDDNKELDKIRLKGNIFQTVKDMEQKVTAIQTDQRSEQRGAFPKSDTKRQEKYKKIHDHWLAIEKHEADILDIDDLDKESEEEMSKDENVPTLQTDENVSTLQNDDGILTEDEKKSEELPVSEMCWEVLMDNLIVNSGCEADDGNTTYKAGIQKQYTMQEDNLNSRNMDEYVLNVDKHNVIQECNSNSLNLDDQIEEKKEETDAILSSTLIDSSTYVSPSINDSDATCHSISDISGFTSSDIQEHSPTSYLTVNTDARKSASITAAETYCHSLPELEKANQEDIIREEIPVLKESFNDSKVICQSISDLEEPIIETLASEPCSSCLTVLPIGPAEHSQDMQTDVFVGKISEGPAELKCKSGDRLTSNEIKIDIKATQQPQKLYKSEVELQVDRSGKVTPPATSRSDPLFFKAPEKPPRIKKQTSSSSRPSSPDISADNHKDHMDSPKSEKLSTSRDSPRTVSECSVSQDDSGNVSGGSRGTTPEHRRTDSSYSQSSIPSSLSNVTDEDEDIDRIVAKVRRQSNASRGSNLLSVFGDSRESLASYYSDAGDITYSNVPITGEVLFSLNYNYKTNMLEVGVKQCRNIAVADTKRRRSDPYVKTYLLPDRTRGGKRKTKVKKHTTNPAFEETLKYSLTKSELENRTLWLTVWHNDRFGRNVFLGEVTINFDYYKFEDPFPKWYPLQERMDAPPPSMMVYKGDLSICIRFVPAEKLRASPSNTGKQKKEGGKGLLQVMVKEARNLTGVKSNGFSDPFCKAYLLPERHKSSKQKTAVVKKDCSPVWNHTFIFEDVTLMELRERCLELTIWDYEKLTSNDFLGGIRLNLGTGVSGGKPVDWMDARGEEMSMWQAMLDRPNIWIDGALILRPNMEKRKF